MILVLIDVDVSIVPRFCAAPVACSLAFFCVDPLFQDLVMPSSGRIYLLLEPLVFSFRFGCVFQVVSSPAADSCSSSGLFLLRPRFSSDERG
jgi:hypothetical protein